MKWFNKTQNKQTKEDINLKTSTHTTSDPMLKTSVQKRAYHTTKTPMVADGGKTKKRASTTRMRKYRTIPKSVYDSAKKLMEVDVPQAEIARILSISTSSIMKIAQSEDWEHWEKMRSDMSAYRTANKQKELERKRIEVLSAPDMEDELERWQFIVGWANESQRIQANAVRDLAKALGLRVEE